MSAVTDLETLLDRVNGRTGLRLAWFSHNSRGYGRIYQQMEHHTGITNPEILGTGSGGVLPDTALAAVAMLDNLLDLGMTVDVSALPQWDPFGRRLVS